MRIALINEYDGKFHKLKIEYGDTAYTVIETTDLDKFNTLYDELNMKFHKQELEEWIKDFIINRKGFPREKEDD